MGLQVCRESSFGRIGCIYPHPVKLCGIVDEVGEYVCQTVGGKRDEPAIDSFLQ
jgi:hypothetical protein